MYGALIVMLPDQAVHAPFCTFPMVGAIVSVMVFVYMITLVEVLQPVSLAVVLPLYPAPEACSVMGNDAFANVPLAPMDIITVIAGQPLATQAGDALHMSSQ
jgi:hypothetical protein